MSAVFMVAVCLGGLAVAVVVLAHAVVKECRECDDMPDRHGDYPGIPPEVIEKAYAEAKEREAKRQREMGA